MKTTLKRFTASLVLILGMLHCYSFQTNAQNIFRWQTVTSADWNIPQDSIYAFKDAVIIFEKVIADDRELNNGEMYYSVYQRIRILSNAGKEYGNVSILFHPAKEKILEIRGRVLHPGGKEIRLQATDVRTKELVNVNETVIKESSFSLPGMSANCIIEYYYNIKREEVNSLWVFQKGIPVRYGEYSWFMVKGNIVNNSLGIGFFLNLLGIGPNYLAINTAQPVEIEQLPSPDNAEVVVFKVHDVPAFQLEPFSPPAVSLQGQIRYYYARSDEKTVYWQRLRNGYTTSVNLFINKRKELASIVELYNGFSTPLEKVNAVYTWIHEHIKNVAHEKNDGSFEENNTIEDLLENGYGTSLQINALFCAFLEEMNIKSNIIQLYDKDRALFLPEAKYWQFDRSIVAVHLDANKPTYYAPAERSLPPGQIPWYCEGMVGFNSWGDSLELFYTIPPSTPKNNFVRRTFSTVLINEEEIKGKITIEASGRYAHYYRILDKEVKEQNGADVFTKYLKTEIPAQEIDSVITSGVTNLNDAVKINAALTYTGLNTGADDRLYIHPVKMMFTTENPFKAKTRTQSIIFNNAYQILDSMSLVVPASYTIESIPEEIFFANDVGNLSVSFSRQENLVFIKCIRTLQFASWKPSAYNKIQELFNTVQETGNLTIVLKQTTSTTK